MELQQQRVWTVLAEHQQQQQHALVLFGEHAWAHTYAQHARVRTHTHTHTHTHVLLNPLQACMGASCRMCLSCNCCTHIHASHHGVLHHTICSMVICITCCRPMCCAPRQCASLHCTFIHHTTMLCITLLASHCLCLCRPTFPAQRQSRHSRTVTAMWSQPSWSSHTRSVTVVTHTSSVAVTHMRPGRSVTVSVAVTHMSPCPIVWPSMLVCNWFEHVFMCARVPEQRCAC
jgi:hypothetical protein